MTGSEVDVMSWITTNIERIGIIGLLGLTVYALLVGHLVPRPFYDRALKDIDEWQTRYARLQELAERAAALAIARGQETRQELPR